MQDPYCERICYRKDVKRAFKSAAVPLGGIVQGAMVVRGKLYQAMTFEDYHVAVACKVQGTWNLHNVAFEEKVPLDFFLDTIKHLGGRRPVRSSQLRRC